MCSEPSSDAAPAARCLLCNVGCPVRVIRSGPDQYLPDYVPHAGYAGLCGRGSVLVELLDHPERIHESHRHAPGGRVVIGTETAAKEIAETLRSAGPAAILVDGNFDVDAIAAVGRLAAAVGARWSVCVEASDAGLVHGLDSSALGAASLVGPEALAAADAVLIIGNAYATHPVAAHWIFEAKTSHPRMKIFAIMDACGVTAGFAGAVFQPRLAPGEAARAVDAIASGKADGLGPDSKVLAACAKALGEAEKPAIVVGANLGYADAQALGKAVAKLAAKVGATVCPLTTYGNAWGAMRAGAAAGAGCPIELMKSGPKTLLVIGRDMGKPAALKGVERLMYVGPMPNETSRAASLVMPAAFAFESAGRALLGPGREVSFGPLLAPPAGVPTLREVLAMMGAGADARGDVSKPAAGAPDVPCGKAEQPADGAIVLALACDPFDFADGSLTRQASWPRSVRPRPVLAMAASDAGAAGLVNGEVVRVDGPAGSARVEVQTSEAQRPGQARASAAFAELRSIFGWAPGVRVVGDPATVRLRKV